MNSSFSAHVNGTALPLWYLSPACSNDRVAFGFYYGVKVLNLVLGTPCNLLVLWHIASRKSDASTSDIFILNLAVLDAYFCLMTPIDLVNRLLLGNKHIWGFQRFAYGVKDTAPLFLVCICLDRYMAVVHPVVFSHVRDNKLRVLVSMLVWGMVLAYGMAKGLVYNNLVQFELFTAIILVAFFVMLFSNVSIIWVLRRSVAGKEEMHPVKKKALRMVIIILGIIVFNYLPPVVLMPFSMRYTYIDFHCKIVLVVYLVMDLSSSIEPLVYLTKMEGGCCHRGQTKGPHGPPAA